jgi:lipopolysaccharide export system permease protein
VNLLHRYIFRSVFIAALLSVGLFVFVLVAGNALRDVLSLLAGGRLSWGLFLKLLALLIPYVVAYALPLGMLTGILMVFGRLSAQREITAMKSVGLSMYRIAAPVFLVAFMGTALCIAINFYYAPMAKHAYRASIKNLLRENPLQFIQPRTFIKDFPGYVLYVGERNGQTMNDFWIWELDDEDQVSVFLKANRGAFSYDDKLDAIILTLYQGSGEKREHAALDNLDNPASLPTLMFDQLSIRLPLTALFGHSSMHKSLSMSTLGELVVLRNEAYAREQAGDLEAFKERIKIQTQIQKGFAMAFSIFALASIAIPLGIKANRSETYANLALAVGLALSYYFFVILATWLQGAPRLRPDILVWAPNLAFQSLGFYLLYRTNKH